MGPMDLCILDLSGLRYQWNATRSTLTVFSPRRDVLAVVATPAGLGDREAAFRACDAALATARLLRLRIDTGPAGEPRPTQARHRLGLYNPYTAEVSVGAVPDTRVFSDDRPLALPHDGLCARLDDSDPDALVVDDRVLGLVEPTWASLTRTYAAQRA